MTVVKINAIEIPAGAGPELEKRFAARAGSVEGSPGFIRFQLLRPVKGDDRYFVLTEWENEESFQEWSGGRAKAAHGGEQGGEQRKPVASGASLLEFEVVQNVEEDA